MTPRPDERATYTHPRLDQAWLAGADEPVLEPDLPIIDPHHHLWDRSGPYFAPQLVADANAGHLIEATVAVQCFYGYRQDGPESLRPVGETEFLVEQGRAAESLDPSVRACAGIVGYADLTLGAAVGAVLDAHVEAGDGRFRGIRGVAADDPEFRSHLAPVGPHLLLNERYREGFAQLEARNLTFDAWLYHPQLADVADLAAAFPATTVVLDHVGTPLGIERYRGASDLARAEWIEGMRMLAVLPNVVVKLGGLSMIYAGHDLHTLPTAPSSEQVAAVWRSWILDTIDIFGTERCMFESNFPVDKAATGPVVLWNAFKRIVADFSAAEKAALFHDTAASVYRI